MMMLINGSLSRDKYSPPAPLAGVVEEVAEHFVEVLRFAGNCNVGCDINCELQPFVCVELCEGRDMIGDPRRQQRPHSLAAAKRCCAGARQTFHLKVIPV
jgi:hypothetical protein